MSRYELFHKIADAECASVRRKISELGLKAAFDFRNVDTGETAAPDLVMRGGNPDQVPVVWDGRELFVGRAAIETLLARLPQP
ncbi:MAG: hypothetical protein AAB250_11545 [Bdellovibrionota bacterium]